MQGSSGLSPLAWWAALSAFGLVLALSWMAVLLYARRRIATERTIEERLAHSGLGSPTGTRTLRLWHEGREETTVVAGDLLRAGLRERLEQIRKDAGILLPVEGIATLVLGAAIVAAVLAYALLGNSVHAVLAALAALIVAWWYLSMRVSRRAALFERQLVDGLELSARALRAGHPLYGAFELIANEVPPPLGNVFREITQQQAMGVRLEDALRRAAMLSPSGDMKLFSAALSIQLRTGGNLADVMEGLAFVIRERMRLNRRFRVLIAQTQFSKRILLTMPFFMFALLYALNPEYTDPLFTTRAGNWMLAVAALGLMCGWFVMNWMSKLRV
jgi:tight adherence protein B